MKTINAKKISDKLITEYIKDSSRLFCQDCRELKPKSEMWVQYYYNGLYGFTCLDCHGSKS
jgi:RNase P subunit RPR2